jgi:drug/metabolite transporter (DMT)-like permease
MKPLAWIGALLILLGVLSFVVPIPHRDDHSVKIGDSRIGIQTQSSEKVPVAASVVLLGAGVLTLVLGARKD